MARTEDDVWGFSLTPTPTPVVSPTPTVTPTATINPNIYGPGKIPTAAIPTTTSSTVDLRPTLSKLTGGQTLSDDEKRALGLLPPVTSTAGANTVVNTSEVPVTTKKEQQLPQGFSTGAWGADLAAIFGEAPANIMGWKLTPVVGKDGKTYSQLSVSEKGAYGDATSGYSTYGAYITKDASGKWVPADMSFAAGAAGNGSNTNITSTGSTAGTTSTGPTLAKDIFKGTLALLFGQAEANKPWMDELYTVVSKFYKGGATAEESFNLAIQDVRNNPNMQEFTKRFKGIYALQDLRQQGKPVTVPTIAEYFATQTKMADLLKSTGLGEIATEDFLGDVIGKGVSATEFGTRITNIFDRIDLAPQEMKDTLARYYPTLDRIQLAKALALGEKGSVQLQKDLSTYEVLAAAEEQGIGALGAGAIAGGLTEERAASLAAGGETFQSALGKFKTVAQLREPAAKLSAIYGMEPMTQADIENIIFKQSAQETMALENLVKAEEAMFSGRAGTIGSRSFASQARGLGQI